MVSILRVCCDQNTTIGTAIRAKSAWLGRDCAADLTATRKFGRSWYSFTAPVISRVQEAAPIAQSVRMKVFIPIGYELCAILQSACQSLKIRIK
jgi:hypothetical protein